MTAQILLDYSYLGPEGVLSATSIMLVLAFIAVGSRYFTRYQTESQILADDILILTALIFFIGMCISMIIGVKGRGVGYPTPPPPPSSHISKFLYTSPEQQLVGKIEAAVQWLQILSLGCTKASVLMFYRRLFCVGGPRNWFSTFNTGLLILVTLWATSFFFDFIFSCGTHLNAMWSTVAALEEHCKGSTKGQMAYAITDFITDLFIICLPIPMVSRLHISTKRKLAVIGVFMLGALAVAASILRMAIFIKVNVSGFNPAQDGSLTVTLFLFWSIIESGLAIVAACLPTLNFLFKGLKLASGSFFSTLRSALSRKRLHSQSSSSASYSSKTAVSYKTPNSRTNMEAPSLAKPSIESFAMGGLPDLERLDNLPATNIMVQKSIHRLEDAA